MKKAITGEGDCDHLSHLASCMRCNNLVKLVTNNELRVIEAMRGQGAQVRTKESLCGVATNLSSLRYLVFTMT